MKHTTETLRTLRDIRNEKMLLRREFSTEPLRTRSKFEVRVECPFKIFNPSLSESSVALW